MEIGVGSCEGGLALWRVLPPEPVRAKGFDERQRYVHPRRSSGLRSNNSGVRNTHFEGAQLLELLRDEKFWLMFAIAFLSMIANGPISRSMPLVIVSHIRKWFDVRGC